MLSEWLADVAKLPYFHIDPLKIDVARVCSVVSHAYATRFHILPVAVTGDEVVVATAEPFMREWVEVLQQATRLRVTPVVANPGDILRYLAEFYSLARSVRQALRPPARVQLAQRPPVTTRSPAVRRHRVGLRRSRRSPRQ